MLGVQFDDGTLVDENLYQARLDQDGRFRNHVKELEKTRQADLARFFADEGKGGAPANRISFFAPVAQSSATPNSSRPGNGQTPPSGRGQ